MIHSPGKLSTLQASPPDSSRMSGRDLEVSYAEKLKMKDRPNLEYLSDADLSEQQQTNLSHSHLKSKDS